MRFTELMDAIMYCRLFEPINSDILFDIRDDFKQTLGTDVSDVLVNHTDDDNISVELVFENDKQKTWYALKWL